MEIWAEFDENYMVYDMFSFKDVSLSRLGKETLLLHLLMMWLFLSIAMTHEHMKSKANVRLMGQEWSGIEAEVVAVKL